MTIKALAFLFALLACGGAPSVTITAGRSWPGDSSLEGWPVSHEPVDTLLVGVTIPLGPRHVQVVGVEPARREPAPAYRLVPHEEPQAAPQRDEAPEAEAEALEPAPAEQGLLEPAPGPQLEGDPEASNEGAEPDTHPLRTPQQSTGEKIEGAARAYDAMDWLTRVLLFLAACWLGYVYREQLGGLIPGRAARAAKRAECEAEEK